MWPVKQEHNMLYVSIKRGNFRYLQIGMDDLWKTLKSKRKVSVLFQLGYLTCMKT